MRTTTVDLSTVSKTLFGNSVRLPLLAAVATAGGPFYARELAEELDVADNLVTTQLSRMAALGLLDRRVTGRTVVYEKLPSALWELALGVHEEFAERPLAANQDDIGLQVRPTADPYAVRRLLREPIALAGALFSGVDVYVYEQLAGAVIEDLMSGKAADGLQVSDIAEQARVGRGRFAELFNDDWQPFSELVIRATCARASQQVLYEELSTAILPARRNDNSPGVERTPGRGVSLHSLISCVATSDRVVPVSAIPLLVGTRDDPMSVVADHERIARLASDLGRTPPATLADHIHEVLRTQARLRQAVADAARTQPGVLEMSIARIARAFSTQLYIGPLTLSAAASGGVTSTLMPGQDDAVVEVVQAAGRKGILACGDTRTWGEEAVELASSVSFKRLPVTYGLGLANLFDVEYRWSASERLLLRLAPDDRRAWRLVEFNERELLHAVAVIELHEQVNWPKDALTRWGTDGGLGLLRARAPRTRQAMTALINVAYAATVDASRRSAAAVVG